MLIYTCMHIDTDKYTYMHKHMYLNTCWHMPLGVSVPRGCMRLRVPKCAKGTVCPCVPLCAYMCLCTPMLAVRQCVPVRPRVCMCALCALCTTCAHVCHVLSHARRVPAVPGGARAPGVGAGAGADAGEGRWGARQSGGRSAASGARGGASPHRPPNFH